MLQRCNKCCKVTMLQCFNVAKFQCCNIEMLQCCRVAMLGSCKVVRLQSCNVSNLQTCKIAFFSISPHTSIINISNQYVLCYSPSRNAFNECRGRRISLSYISSLGQSLVTLSHLARHRRVLFLNEKKFIPKFL